MVCADGPADSRNSVRLPAADTEQELFSVYETFASSAPDRACVISDAADRMPPVSDSKSPPSSVTLRYPVVFLSADPLAVSLPDALEVEPVLSV